MSQTPGPWRVEEYSDSGNVYVEGAGNLPVAKVYGVDRPTRKANAALLASAPELLRLNLEAAAIIVEGKQEAARFVEEIAKLVKQRRRLFAALDYMLCDDEPSEGWPVAMAVVHRLLDELRAEIGEEGS